MASGAYDTLAEAGVIATILNNPPMIMLSISYLKAGHFYHKENGAIYWAITNLYEQGIDNIDALNITAVLNSHAGVRKIVDEYKLPEITEYIQTCAAVARHTNEEYKALCDIVFSFAYRRELIKSASSITSISQNLEIQTPDAKDKITNILSNLDKQFITGELTTFGERVDELWNSMGSKRGIQSKFSVFNDFFTYEPGELYVVKARMKEGKSALLMNEAIHMLLNNVPVLYFDTEMSDELFLLRMLSNLTGISMNAIRYRSYSPEEYDIVRNAINWIKNAPFVHLNEPSFTLDEISTVVGILKRKLKIEFIVYDYIKDNSTNSAAELSNSLGAKTDFLKNGIATRFKVPVLAAAQLNREFRIADSDKIGRYMTVGINWRGKNKNEQNRDGYECGNCCARVDLNRIGESQDESDYLDFQFDYSTMRIEQAKRHASDKPF